MAERNRKVCITVYPTYEQADALQQLSTATHVPMSVYIREGIDLVVQRKLEQLHRDTLHHAAALDAVTDGDKRADFDRRKKAFEGEYAELCERYQLCIGMRIPYCIDHDSDLPTHMWVDREDVEEQVKLEVQQLNEQVGEMDL